jgi:methionyl aminopeptidase
MTPEESILKAGHIAAEIKKWIRPQIKKGMLLLEIAEKIENKIYEMDAEPSVPVNLSINEQAAHYTPSPEDKSIAKGLLKIDFGAHINGWISDTAFSMDLENSEINKELIEASKNALENVEKNLSKEKTFGQIGGIIESSIKQNGFNPIVNLSGHSMEQYDLHSGISIPNIDNKSDFYFSSGLYAIEPFATNGSGKVHDGIKGNIYSLIKEKNTRSFIAKEVLKFIKENYKTLPFASRWIYKKFGSRARIALMILEKEGILHQYPILTEKKGKLVSQAENTFLIKKDKVIITTKED